jgi:hypothetical protein
MCFLFSYNFFPWILDLGLHKKGEAVLATSLVYGVPVIEYGIESNREHLRQAGRFHFIQRTFPLVSLSDHHTYNDNACNKSQVNDQVHIIFQHCFHGLIFYCLKYLSGFMLFLYFLL